VLKKRINTLVDALGMGEFADRRAKGFPKGQVREVAAISDRIVVL